MSRQPLTGHGLTGHELTGQGLTGLRLSGRWPTGHLMPDRSKTDGSKTDRSKTGHLLARQRMTGQPMTGQPMNGQSMSRRPATRPRTGLMLIMIALVLSGCAAGPMERAVVRVGDQRFDVEVARSFLQQRDGLSDSTQVPEGTGMLFPFDRPDTRTVWMEGMLVPIDIAWIASGRVVEARTLPPCRKDSGSCPKWTSPQEVEALLEVSAGALDGVEVGTAVTISRR